MRAKDAQLKLKPKPKPAKRGRKTGRRKPDFVDMHAGNKLRELRFVMGISQVRLAGMVGLSFQQIQKYEHGTNRIPINLLWEFARILGVEVSDFFPEREDESVQNVRPEVHKLLKLAKRLSPQNVDTIRRMMEAGFFGKK